MISEMPKKFKQILAVYYNSTKLFIKNGWARRNARYIKGYRNRPIKDNMILYDSFWGRGAMCNPYALFEYLLHDPDYVKFEHVWALDDPREYADTVKRYQGYPNVRFVRYLQRDYLVALCEAKYLICNTAFPRFFIKRKGQIYINTWHGIPLKKVGRDIPGGNLESGNVIRNFLSADYIVSANAFLTQIYRKTYALEGLYTGKIIEEGYPRLDTLLRYSREECENRLRRMGVSIDPQRKIVLYAPTWRDVRNGEKYIDSILIEYHEVKTRIEENIPEYQVLVKVHQYVYQQLKGRKHPSYIIPATIDANEVLPIADILLGDYSSIFFDYLYFERPILFYIPDIDQYTDYRGLYMPIDSLPGPASKNLDEIIGWLKIIDDVAKKHKESLLETKKWCCNYEVGNISKRILNIVFRGYCEGYTLIDTKSKKQKILLQTGDLSNESTALMVFSLLEQIDQDRYDVTIATPLPSTPREKDLFKRFDHKVRIVVQNRYINMTYRDSIKNKLLCDYGFSNRSKKSYPIYLYQEEAHRRYADCHFDFAVHLGDYDFADLMVVALLRKENPESAGFDNNFQNQQAIKLLLSEIKNGKG